MRNPYTAFITPTFPALQFVVQGSLSGQGLRWLVKMLPAEGVKYMVSTEIRHPFPPIPCAHQLTLPPPWPYHVRIVIAR